MTAPAPEPRRLTSGVNANRNARRKRNAALPDDQKDKGGRPSILDTDKYWVILQRLAYCAALGAPRKLMARAVPCAYETLRVWTDSGDDQLDALPDDVRTALNTAVEAFLTPVDSGGGPRFLLQLTDEQVSRLAKLSAVIQHAEAQYIQNALGDANRASRKGDGRLALQMLTRKYPDDYNDPPQKIATDAHVSGSLGLVHEIKRVTVAVPANGFRPGEQDAVDADYTIESESPDVPAVPGSDRHPSAKRSRRKAGRKAGHGRPGAASVPAPTSGDRGPKSSDRGTLSRGGYRKVPR